MSYQPDEPQSSPSDSHDPPDRFKLLAYRYPLVFFVAAWIVGIGLASIITSKILCIAMTLGCGLATLCSFKQPRLRLNMTLALATVSFVSAWYSLSYPSPQQDSLTGIATRRAQPIALRGVVRQAAVWSPNPYHRETDPSSKPWNTKWLVCWDEIRNDANWIPVTSRSYLYTSGRVTDFLPGDRVEVFGNIERIVEPTNPGMPDFAARSQVDGIFVSIRTEEGEQIQRLASTNKYWLDRLRGRAIRWIDAALRKNVTFDQAPLAAALIFGQREQVEWESQQQLMATGTLHMLSISGMHVEMIAAALILLCQLLNLRSAVTATLLIGSCSAYAVLAGANPPVIRALILIIAFTAGRLLGFNARLPNLLALAAFLILVQSPHNLSNIGVQLSFLAVATIAVFNQDIMSPRRSALQSLIEESLPSWRRWTLSIVRRGISGLKLSFWVGLLTCPLIWDQFHVVSLVSIPLNVLLSIPLLIGLLSGLLTALLAWVPLLCTALGAISGSCLALIVTLIDLFYRIPGGHIWLPSPQRWWSFLFLVIIIVWIPLQLGQKRLWLGCALVFWMAVGLGMQAFGPRGFSGMAVTSGSSSNHAELRCTFIDVGHGTSVVIELPDGRLWLYDAGHMGASERSHQVIASTLWALGTARIDTLVLSHADSDHYNATTGLMQRFQVGRVVSTQRFWGSPASEVRKVQQLVTSAGIKVESWNSQTAVELVDETAFQVLHPPPKFRAETDNADSLCMQIEHAGTRILLPGDVEGSGLVNLCEQPPRLCQVLMAPHHGSLAHDVSELLAWCSPKIVVISGNHRAARPEVLQRFADAEQVGVTYTDGAVQIRIRNDGTTQVVRWNHNHWIAF